MQVYTIAGMYIYFISNILVIYTNLHKGSIMFIALKN